MFGFFRRKKKPPEPPAPPSGLAEATRRVELFRKFNRDRLGRLRDLLPEPRRKVFDLLPILLHEEIPDFAPAGTAPFGISCFTLTPERRKLLQEFFPTLEPSARGRKSLPLLFLAVMGSAGTLAFTGESDVDFWVGLDTSHHSPAALAALQAKLSAIEQWTLARCGLEIHFFVVDPEKIRKNDFGEAQGESCGTALGRLLKDEFYRTAIFLEGRLPIYWTLPAGAEGPLYHEASDRLQKEPGFSSDLFADFGDMGRIDADEYYGASLWHLLKGLSSPFKSVLKIALLDCYAEQGAAEPPLCEQYKSVLFRSGNAPDPYLFMADAARRHYTRVGRHEESRLVESCFLIKTFQTGQAGASQQTRRRIREAVAPWALPANDLERLEKFQEWDYDSSEAFRKRILAYLLNTYKAIRARTQGKEARISERDLTVIGRKMHAFLSRVDKKMPREFSIFHPRQVGGFILEEEAGPPSDTAQWRIRVQLRGGLSAAQPLLKSPDLLFSCFGYLALNGFFRRGHTLVLKGRTKLSQGDASSLLEALSNFLGSPSIEELPSENYLRSPAFTKIFIVPNWRNPDWPHGLESLFFYLQNDHGETFIDHFQGETSLKRLLTEVLENQFTKDNLARLACQVFRPKERHIIRQRVADNLEAEIKKKIGATLC